MKRGKGVLFKMNNLPCPNCGIEIIIPSIEEIKENDH